MGQSVSFYVVSESKFNQIAERPEELPSLFHPSVSRYTLGGTFMGITYLLKKVKPESYNTIKEIFEPPEFEFKGEAPELDPFYFHKPSAVQRILGILGELSEEELSNSFNAEELNGAKVYPWCWSNEEGGVTGFRKEHLLKDYSTLKKAFSKANDGNEYLLCFIG